MTDFIKAEGHEENWVCLCGNTPRDHGFYPCNHDGIEVEPTTNEWSERLYVCDNCGRIIEQDTLAIVGFRQTTEIA